MLRSLPACFLVLALAFLARSSPVGNADQIPLLAADDSLGAVDYRNGELPPTENTEGWVDPRLNGGRFIDFTTRRLGEPLNIVISALSDPWVLEEPGFLEYSQSIGFAGECMGLHYGNIHNADLGDGLGRKGEHLLIRQHYFPVIGTCWESVRGGHHFRAWKQNGTLANSGAWFIGASKEKDSSNNHRIDEDGYNLGRDFFVERAIAGSHWQGKWWRAEIEWREGLMPRGRRGINHGIAVDGRVAILTVKRL
ncbi:hypothetical protein PsYK624_077830 [Phanerochaete sordida]|uniref:Uncharacterized protein n=1 Tax=Phanerochaete sordida TaxID=48140 RepID=A0A9P3LEL2_9APHY|nr:hypothetical protein PsYK624_077830 [Phanerochaete sordida]